MWVKICGVNDVRCLDRLIAAAPDAIGLNFYQKSTRCVEVPNAATIVAALPASITPIGLFVNHSEAEIRRICASCSIRTIQLHGEESPEFAAGLGDFQIYRAFRVGSGGMAELEKELATYQRLGVNLQGCLVDAKVEGAYGGTGRRAPWELLAREWSARWPPLILAGGLTPENVAQAITQVRPYGVDVASGVESAPGRQNPEAVERFIHSARHCNG